MKEMKVRITFVEPILGSANADPDVHSEFIASKAPDAPTREQEVEALGTDEVERKETTVFPRDKETGKPIIWAYQIRGFFKHACGMCKLIDDCKASAKIKAHKKYIDGLVYIYDGKHEFSNKESKKILINTEEEITSCQRPLRASTAQGDRVALANSESISDKSTAEFTVRVLKDDLIDAVKEWLDYGVYNGLGQWRNSGKGSFTWEEIK